MAASDNLKRSIRTLGDVQVLRNAHVTEAKIPRSLLQESRHEHDVEIVAGLVAHGHEDLEQLFRMPAVDLDRAAGKREFDSLGGNIIESTAWPLALLVMVEPARARIVDLKVGAGKLCEEEEKDHLDRKVAGIQQHGTNEVSTQEMAGSRKSLAGAHGDAGCYII